MDQIFALTGQRKKKKGGKFGFIKKNLSLRLKREKYNEGKFLFARRDQKKIV